MPGVPEMPTGGGGMPSPPGGGGMPSVPGGGGGGDKGGGDQKGAGKGSQGGDIADKVGDAVGDSATGGALGVIEKVPGMGDMVGAIKKALGMIVIYMVIVLLAGAGMCLYTVIKWLSNGITNSNSPTGIQCYSNSDNYPQEIRFMLDGKGYNVSGGIPSDITQPGQTSRWVNTGFQTDGNTLQVYVTGGWYPWGIEAVGKKISILNQANVAPDQPPDKDGGVTYTLHAKKIDLPCKTTTDLSLFSDSFVATTFPYGTSIADVNNYIIQNFREVNHLLRYADVDSTGNGLTGIDAQMEEIIDVHCTGTATGTTIPTNICNSFRPVLGADGMANTDFTPCYLGAGHGVYMKIGNTNYAYHLANHEVSILERKDNSDGSFTIQQQVDDMSAPMTMLLPFSLPTQIYGKFPSWTDVVAVTNSNPYMVPYAGSVPGMTIKQDPLGGSGPNGCYSGSDAVKPDLINETCPPPPNQPIYVMINDINYGDNGGFVELIFPSGAKRVAQTTDFYNGSVFTKIATWIFSPMYGDTMTSGKTITGACQTTKYDSSGNLVSTGQSCGVMIEVRNMFLSNFTFQTLKILLVILYVFLYGFGLIKGNVQMNLTDITKRMLNLTFIMWATSPTNYEFIDSFIIPMFFSSCNSISVILVSAALKFAGINTSIDDPFAVFDVLLGQMFSDVVGLKMIAAVNNNFVFLIGLPLVWVCMISVAVIMFKVALSYALSIFFLGLFIILSPLVILMMLSEYTQQAFDKWLKNMMQESMNSIVSLFFVALLFVLIYKPFSMIFNYDICWSVLNSINILNIIKINEYGWQINNPPSYGYYFLAILLFTATTYLLSEFKYQVLSIGDTLFGGGGITSPQQGEKMFGSMVGTVLGSDNGTGVSVGGMAGGFAKRTPFVGDKLHGAGSMVGGMLQRGAMSNNPLGDFASFAWKEDISGQALKGVYDLGKKGFDANQNRMSNLMKKNNFTQDQVDALEKAIKDKAITKDDAKKLLQEGKKSELLSKISYTPPRKVPTGPTSPSSSNANASNVADATKANAIDPNAARDAKFIDAQQDLKLKGTDADLGLKAQGTTMLNNKNDLAKTINDSNNTEIHHDKDTLKEIFKANKDNRDYNMPKKKK